MTPEDTCKGSSEYSQILIEKSSVTKFYLYWVPQKTDELIS